ncbi:MAG: hypothetical protein P4K92_06475 [Candidatus Nitrosotalea sp.]|nr:hypothetical protein [Candidatus Nitrosotalea sp.]
MTKWDTTTFSIKIVFVAMGITLFGIAIMIVLAVYGFPITTPTKDLSNLTVLVGGSGIALFISLTILAYSDKQGRESTQIISDIKNIVVDQKEIMKKQGSILENQEKIRNEKQEFAEQRCWFFLDHMKRDLLQMKAITKKPDSINTANAYKEVIIHLSRELQEFKNAYAVDLAPTIISLIDTIIEEIKEIDVGAFLTDPNMYDDILENIGNVSEKILSQGNIIPSRLPI